VKTTKFGHITSQNSSRIFVRLESNLVVKGFKEVIFNLREDVVVETLIWDNAYYITDGSLGS